MLAKDGTRRGRQRNGANVDFGAMEVAFRDFLRYPIVISKDYGPINLELFDAQDYMLKEIFGGLKNDVHFFVIGKGRQLGSTTICGLLDCFFVGAIPGIQGAIVYDTEPNKEMFRIQLTGILERLPPAHRLPIRKHSKDGILFENGSVLQYMVAGVKKGRGTLGRSRSLNYCHATELCSFGDPEAFEAFRDSLSEGSDAFPARLYIFESTAREPDISGSDIFMDLWEEAVEDTIAKKAIFLGWWRKETNSYARGTALFKRYGYSDLSDEEKKLTAEVQSAYKHHITLEQWAWFRHRSDPRARADFVSDNEQKILVVAREHPTTIAQLFAASGGHFIPADHINRAVEEARHHPYKAYKFYLGEDITGVHIEQLAPSYARHAQLRVWDEPVAGGRYILSGDPAYSGSEESDFFVATVCRVYGDRIVQVAEFATRNMADYQFAWVMAYLANMYGNCRMILEINGPGEAVLTEFRHLRTMLETGKFSISRKNDPLSAEDQEHNQRFKTFLRGVGDYMYHRPDSFSGGYNAQWKTTGALRETIMIQLRDQLILGALKVRSHEALFQMKRLRQEARMIQPEGKTKDDRAVALAMAVRCWIDWERASLIQAGRLYELEDARAGEMLADETFNQWIGTAWRANLAARQADRQAAMRMAARPQWRGGAWRGRR